MDKKRLRIKKKFEVKGSEVPDRPYRREYADAVISKRIESLSRTDDLVYESKLLFDGEEDLRASQIRQTVKEGIFGSTIYRLP